MAEEGGDNETLQLKVKNSEGKETVFKLKKSTALRKMMDAYCQREGLPADGVRFLFEGERLNREHTPESLGMEDGDVIDALIEQTGGNLCGTVPEVGAALVQQTF
jgi:small ubiquitin-related modifier